MKPARLFFATALTLAALVPAAPVAAQGPGVPGRHLIRFGFGGGVSVPTSDARKALENGINGQAYVLLDPGIGFPLRFNLGYQRFDYKSAIAGLGGGQSTIVSGVGGISIDLLQLGPITPYATAGLGAFNVKDEFAAAGATGTTSATNFGIDGGGGLRLRLGRLDAFVEGRVQNVYTDQGAIDTKSIRSVPVTFGFLF